MIKLCLIRFSLLCWLIFSSITLQAATAPTLLLENAAQRFELAPWLDTLPTRFSTLDSSQLLSAPDQLPWQALDQATLAQGSLDNGLWLRLKIRNDGLVQRRIIEFTRANISHIEILTQKDDGSWLTRHAGASEWLPRGDISGPGYSFRLTIPEGDSRIYVHLQSSYPLATPIRLSSENELVRAFQNSAGFFGAVLGMLGGISIGMTTLRSARLSIASRWIFAALTMTVILQALIERDILGYWWLGVPNSQYSLIQLSAGMLSIMHLLLCRQYLIQRRVISNAALYGLRICILANLMWMLFSVAWLPNQWSLMADCLRWLCLLAIIAMLWRPARQACDGAVRYVLIILTGLISQLFCDASLHGYLPFIAEPYEVMMVWHLLALPALLYTMQLPATSRMAENSLVSSQSRPAVNKAHAVPATAVSPRVLVVEDNPWVQQVLAGLLLKLHCQPSLAGNGLDALKCLEGEKFDLVLMDCDLPELDGFSATQHWRSQTSSGLSDPRIPIIAITAHISASHRMQAHDAGMDDFLQKPIDMRALHEVLSRWLPHYSAKT